MASIITININIPLNYDLGHIYIDGNDPILGHAMVNDSIISLTHD